MVKLAIFSPFTICCTALVSQQQHRLFQSQSALPVEPSRAASSSRPPLETQTATVRQRSPSAPLFVRSSDSQRQQRRTECETALMFACCAKCSLVRSAIWCQLWALPAHGECDGTQTAACEAISFLAIRAHHTLGRPLRAVLSRRSRTNRAQAKFLHSVPAGRLLRAGGRAGLCATATAINLTSAQHKQLVARNVAVGAACGTAGPDRGERESERAARCCPVVLPPLLVR